MFELNLIKDKAKARQRRRVIFLSIVSILFLSGLVAIFVGSLFWRETTELAKVNDAVAAREAERAALDADLNIREPKAKKRRNALIDAWNEDMAVLTDRPYFNPLLEDIADNTPQTPDFWYKLITISVHTAQGGSGPRGTAGEDEFAQSKELLNTRSLLADGYIKIEGSDILTESELAQVATSMSELRNLVGEPTFTLDVSNEITPPNAPEDRYVPFTMRAAQTQFSSGVIE